MKDFTEKASKRVKPNSFMLDNEVDVKIICNEWGSYKDSAYINGVVIQKKVIDRRLNDTHNDPRILLLSNSLGYVRDDNDFTDFQSIIKQEDHFVEIIKEKIARVNPDIVVVECDISKKVADTLRDEKITVISNLDVNTMKRLERTTQTLIYPSTHLLESTTTLGTCSSFYIKRFSAKQHNHSKSVYVNNDRSLIYFDGTPDHLGCTILLFGDKLSNLEKVKSCLTKMINKSRDVILESILLSKMNLSLENTVLEDKNQYMFLAYQNIYVDEPKLTVRMHRMRIGKDIDRLKEKVLNENKDPEEKVIKQNLNEMCILPRK